MLRIIGSIVLKPVLHHSPRIVSGCINHEEFAILATNRHAERVRHCSVEVLELSFRAVVFREEWRQGLKLNRDCAIIVQSDDRLAIRVNPVTITSSLMIDSSVGASVMLNQTSVQLLLFSFGRSRSRRLMGPEI